jgi:hypothetical protein
MKEWRPYRMRAEAIALLAAEAADPAPAEAG